MRVAWVLLLVACGGGGEPVEEPEDAYVLQDEIYRFCHVPGFQGTESRAWCDLVKDLPPERCPGMQETCARPELESVGALGCSPAGGGQPGRLPTGRPELPRELPQACELPESSGEQLSGLVRWIGAIGVAALVLVLLRLLYAGFGRGERPRAPVVAEAPVEEDLPLDDVPDLPSEDLLARARVALEAGTFGEAVLLARGAALRRLGESGRLRLHRSRTDREYVRQLGSEAELRDALRTVVRAVEAHRFGGRALQLEVARAALRAAERILAVALLCWLLVPGDAAGQGLSRYGPFGDAALYDLFEEWGYEVDWLARPFTELGPETDALVLLLGDVVPEEEDWTALRAWVEAGGVLVVGGDAGQAFPELGEAWMIDGAHAQVAGDFEPFLPSPLWPDGAYWAFRGAPSARAWVYAFVSGPDGEANLEPVVISVDVGEGVVLAVADSLLFANAALVHPDNERFLGDMLQVGQGALGWPLDHPIRVTLATRGAGQSESGTPPVTANPRLIPFLLQLGLTWLLVGLWKGWPFGVLRDPEDQGRLRFSEHVTALATRYMRLGATGHAYRAVARLWLHRLGPQGLELAARRAGYTAAQAKALVAQVEEAAAGSGEGRDPEDLERVEELWRVTRGR